MMTILDGMHTASETIIQYYDIYAHSFETWQATFTLQGLFADNRQLFTSIKRTSSLQKWIKTTFLVTVFQLFVLNYNLFKVLL